jgi:hypothetical protein
MATDLWEKIISKITNYAIFRDDLDLIVEKLEDQKAIEKSIGSTIDKASTKVFEFLDKVSQLDLSEAGVKKLVEDLGQVSNKYFQDYGALPPVNKPRRKKKAEAK